MSINFCTLSTSSVAASVATGTATTSVSLIKDGVASSGAGSFYQLRATYTGGTYKVAATATITFAEAADITSVESWHTFGGAFSGTRRVQLFYSAAWTSVLNISGGSPNQQVANGSWASVTKIRYDINITTGSRPQTGLPIYGALLGELRAYGTVAAAEDDYDDNGIRMYDGTDSIALAMRTATDDDPLRIYDGNEVKGFVLVATTDDYASKFRVKTENDGTKALRRL